LIRVRLLQYNSLCYLDGLNPSAKQIFSWVKHAGRLDGAGVVKHIAKLCIDNS
jgi:hypothetical protein